MMRVRAPGSVFLWGEHAVMHGHTALIASTQDEVYADIIPGAGTGDCVLHAPTGHAVSFAFQPTWDPQMGLCSIPETVPVFWKPVLIALSIGLASAPDPQSREACLRHLAGSHWHWGSTLVAGSGLGSSAAVVVAVLLVLHSWSFSGRIATDSQAVWKQAMRVVHRLQNGWGSGGDLAASLWGGAVRYCKPVGNSVPHIVPLSFQLKGSWWSQKVGYKKTVAEVCRLRQSAWEATPQWHARLYALMGSLAEEAARIVQLPDAPAWRLGECLQQAQGLLYSLGVSDPMLSECIWRYQALPGIWGAKISGSGLGDRVIAWGDPGLVEEEFVHRMPQYGAHLALLGKPAAVCSH